METYIETYLDKEFGIKKGEEVKSLMREEGQKLEAWRNRQMTAYLDSGLNEHEATSLLQFVECPVILPTEGRELFNNLAKKAFEDGYEFNLSTSRQAPGL